MVIDDVGNILEAHHAGVRIDHAFCTPSEEAAFVALAEAGVRVSTVPAQQAHAIFGVERASRVFALAHPARPRPMAALGDDARDLVVLDGVRMMGNVGAIVRTTTALGGSGVVLLDSGLTSVYDRRLIRASRGLVFRIPVVLSTAMALLNFCHVQQLPLVASSARSGMEVADLALLTGRVAMVFGGERHGCSPEVGQRATARVRISMTTCVESLNVSVAAGIVLNARSRHNLALVHQPMSTRAEVMPR